MVAQDKTQPLKAQEVEVAQVLLVEPLLETQAVTVEQVHPTIFLALLYSTQAAAVEQYEQKVAQHLTWVAPAVPGLGVTAALLGQQHRQQRQLRERLIVVVAVVGVD